MTKYAGQKIRVVTAEVRRDGRYLITQRLAKSILPHLWEFPGGKVPDGESSEDVLIRLLRDKLGVTAEIGELVMEVVHEYDHYAVDMQVYRCELPEDEEVQLLKVQDARWVSPAEFGDYEFPGADEATISALLDLDDPALTEQDYN
ncbi:MAG TPA: (deoxy)nucleoside triphosphate pyrophosphohydrolase [Deltaproteobacteria bacterium]|nr:NUDIX hydrolase [Deltaproteobacteria bacterium]HCP46851.1 (deoxy)nucleoside triphosphate pyrophosphohydrolase [Deltaproteobacteria bacterium]|tara:strand:+ start:35 stop:472 length:438 start_codon:yes stop_codon:yes gene_type:complete